MPIRFKDDMIQVFFDDFSYLKEKTRLINGTVSARKTKSANIAYVTINSIISNTFLQIYGKILKRINKETYFIKLWHIYQTKKAHVGLHPDTRTITPI